eukprot:PhM_4_TR11455/c0_g1_i1/m.13138
MTSPSEYDATMLSLVAQLDHERSLRKAQQEMHWYMSEQGNDNKTKNNKYIQVVGNYHRPDCHNYKPCAREEPIRTLPFYDMRPWWQKNYGNRTPDDVVHSMEPWIDEEILDELHRSRGGGGRSTTNVPLAPPLYSTVQPQPDETDVLYNDVRVSTDMETLTLLSTHTAATRHHHQREFGGRSIKTPKVRHTIKGAHTASTAVAEHFRAKKLCPLCCCQKPTQQHETWCVGSDPLRDYPSDITPLKRNSVLQAGQAM